MHIIVHNNKAAWKVVNYDEDGGHTQISEEEALKLGAQALNVKPSKLEAWLVPQGLESNYMNAPLDLMYIERDTSGSITSVAPSLPLYLHFDFSGGDGEDPPGILNDGVDALTITATIRATADPSSPTIPISGVWRITIRDDVGAIYDVIRVSVVDGVVNLSYTTTSKPTICKLEESDFDPLPNPSGPPYTVLLAEPAIWKVYRSL